MALPRHIRSASQYKAMAGSVTLDLVLLRSSKGKDIALYLRELLTKHKPLNICNALLAAVESERLSPAIFEVFLNVTGSLDCIMLCMHQKFSIIIRLQGIKHYGKALSSKDRWKEVWQSFDGLDGILQYLSTISVDEVEALCRAIGKSNFGQQKSAQRANAVEGLIKAMNPGLYPETPVRTPDKRPLGSYAGYMVLACSADFVYSLMVDDTKSSIFNRCSKKHLVKVFSECARKYVDAKIWSSKTPIQYGNVPLFLTDLVRRVPSLPSKEKHFSATMEYSENLLEKRIRNPEAGWPHAPTEVDVYFGLLHRCSKRRMVKQRRHSIFDLGMRMIAAMPNLLSRFTSTRKREFWTPIIEYWIKQSEHWEDLLIKGLKLGFEGNSNIPKTFALFLHHKGISDFTEDRIWATLRLFWLHVPKVGVDIDNVKVLDPFTKSTWTTDMLDRLPTDKTIQLLKMLLRANPKFDFLSCQRSNSILNVSNIHGQRNFNALLYLIERQLGSSLAPQRAEALERVVEACADYKNKSVSSKEQQDRAQFAKATGLFAIASRSLEIYGDYVTWLARFIKDPLTVKVLFNRDLIANKEVSNLLSAIPEHISESANLSDISNDVSDADTILITLKEHHKIAKKEPSYHPPDWRAIDTLLEGALQTRIERAKVLQKSLDASQGELYGQLWGNTLSRFSQPGAGTMKHVQSMMSSLVTSLPSKLLLNITKTVQEIEDVYRARKAEGEEAESESHAIGWLANQCLLALAHGDDPTSAGAIIIKTIISRPEASSWHRQMLSIGFFKRLPAASAQQLLLDFADKIGEKLEEQSYVRVGEAANTPSIVKVTTVKYLAQILQGAELFSAESSIDVLLELFKVATHPDIRQATLESMLSTLTGLATAEMQDSATDISESKNHMTQKILAALDSVIPVIGSINERRVPSEQDWRETESDLSLLPAPSQGMGQRPLWGVLIGSANTNKSLKAYFVQRLLLPGLEASIKMHHQWLVLFLKKHKAGFSIDLLPAIPATPTMMLNIVNDFLQYTPYRLFECWVKYIKFLLECPEFLIKFISKLQADEKINTKPDVLHFLEIFGYNTEVTLSMGTYKLATIVNHSWKPSLLDAQQAITLSNVQDAISDHMHLILLQYDRHIKLWNRFLEMLRHPREQADWQHWKTDCRPLLEQMVVLIEGLRTPRWSADPHRIPSILPSTTRINLWLLDYPPTGLSTTVSDQHAVKLGRQVAGFLSDLLKKSGVLVKPDKIIADVMTVSEKIDDRERIQVGTVLGTFTRLEAIEESLRVSMAIEFFNKGLKAVQKDKTLKKQLASILQRWQTSQVEDVRETVINLKNDQISYSLWQVAFRQD